MKISVGTPQLWKIYAESSQQDSVKDVVLFSLFFYFFLMIPGSLLSPPLPHRCQSGGEAGEEGKEAGPGWEWFSRGMLVNIKWVWIYKMVIQGDKIIIHRDNSHGRVGADGDSGLRERSRNRNKIGDLTNTGAVPGGVRVQNQL